MGTTNLPLSALHCLCKHTEKYTEGVVALQCTRLFPGILISLCRFKHSTIIHQCQLLIPAFCSELQHCKNQTGQPLSVKIVSEPTLTINPTTDMPHKHFTTDKRNELAALLRAKVKKKNIAKQLSRDRTTIWRERKRGQGSNGRYYVRKSKRLAKEKRIKANKRFKKIENDKFLRKYVVKKLKKYWSPE